MRTMFVGAAMALGLILAGPARADTASDTAAVNGVLGAFGTTINKGDIAGFSALYVDTPTLLDEFAPFAWSGKGAIAAWLGDFGAWAKANAVTSTKLELGAPEAVNFAGDRAYVTVPVTIYAGLSTGKTLPTYGQFAFLMTRDGAGWKIAGWAYTRTGTGALK